MSDGYYQSELYYAVIISEGPCYAGYTMSLLCWLYNVQLPITIVRTKIYASHD